MAEVVVEDAPGDFEGVSPAALFEGLSGRRYCFFLDSGCDPQKLGRYSIMGCEPEAVFKSRGEKILLETDSGVNEFSGNPLIFLEGFFSEHRIDYAGDVPFVSGAVGYLSYDLGALTEGVYARGLDDVRMWDIELGFYDTTLVCDNLLDRKYFASSGESRGECTGKIEALKKKIGSGSWEEEGLTREKIRGGVKSNFSKGDYLKAVEKIRGYIRAGDTYQVNLSQRFEAETHEEPWTLYRRLRGLNPAPFAAYLSFGETSILSSSPERFLKIRDGTVETRPIKGTRPRGRNDAEDLMLARELNASEKDKAEHLMIVDLERNDLGKVCGFGSVRVDEFEAIESYSTVHHMVSTVRGRLKKNASFFDCIRAAFPGGSITGAPKVRAMEIIDELEPTRRGIYTGSIGYLGFNGVCDLNIVIRTMIVKDGRVLFHAGGGVVYDSDPEAEYDETLDKVKALFESLQ